MAKRQTIFLTGATGILGSYLLKLFLENGHKIFVLAREKDKKRAGERIINVLNFWDKKIFEKNAENLKILDGDIIKENLALKKEDLRLLENEVEEIYHCAAHTKFYAPLDELRKVNVAGFKNILDLACKWKKNGKLNKVNYISSAFVCGNHKGVFKESDLDLGQGFNNNYEKSKFEAELLIPKYTKKGIRVIIFRPSIIVGEQVTGKTMDFKMFYEPIRLFCLEIFKNIPISRKTRLNLMPVDLAAKAIYLLSMKRHENAVYHITNPKNFSAFHFVDLAIKFFQFKRFKFISLKQFKLAASSDEISPAEKKLLDIYIPYFNFFALFDSRHTEEILKSYKFIYPSLGGDFMLSLFSFCVKAGFAKVKRENKT